MTATTLDDDRYARALGTTGRVIAEVRPGGLDDPTPCTEWCVADLVNHLINVARLMANAAEGKPLDVSVLGVDHTRGDVLAAFNDASRRALDAFGLEGARERIVELPVLGRMPGEDAQQIHFADTTTHTWDLARALHVDAAIDDDLAELALEYARIHYAPVPRGPDSPFFADEVQVASTASPVDRLVAFLGRDPAR